MLRVRTLIAGCENNNLVPCIYPVVETEGETHVFYGYPITDFKDGKSIIGSWNLIHAVSKKFVDPFDEASDELIEVSDWELQNWAVKIVANYLYKVECKIIKRFTADNRQRSLCISEFAIKKGNAADEFKRCFICVKAHWFQ